MEKLFLDSPSRKYCDEIRSYREEFLYDGSSMDGTASLRKIGDPEEWIQYVKALSKEETVPQGLVPSTQFLYVRESDQRIVGMIQIRHYLSEYLEEYAGHIGYSVRPSERRKGYAKQMLRDVLPYCRKIGIEKILISCIESNEGSRRTILANGGVYESTVHEPNVNVNLQRYWIHLT